MTSTIHFHPMWINATLATSIVNDDWSSYPSELGERPEVEVQTKNELDALGILNVCAPDIDADVEFGTCELSGVVGDVIRRHVEFADDTED